MGGPSGPSPFPGKSWALPNGNFFNTVDVFGKSAFCICLSPEDPTVENAINGPLSYDFLKDAVLVGRERIVPEYLNTSNLLRLGFVDACCGGDRSAREVL